MRYIDWSHVTNRYRDVAKTADASDGEAYWIMHAEAEIDSRLAVRYSVPFANTPTLTPGIVQDLAIDLTYFKMRVGKESVKELKAYIDERFESILNGTLLIVSSGGNVADDGAALSWSDRTGYHSSFGMDDPVNWTTSSQWVEATQDARDYGV